MTIELSREDARRIAVRAQLLDADRAVDVVEVAEQLGEIKIDPTATIAPCEHTVLWSRIGSSYQRADLHKAVEVDRVLFELNGSFRPVTALPALLPELHAWPTRAAEREYLAANAAFAQDILRRLDREGPLAASAIPDTAAVARDSDGWYGSGQVPRMLEYLGRQGKVAVSRREGRTRIWDLAERVFPPGLVALDPEEATVKREEQRLQALGITRQKSRWSFVGMAGEPAVVEGSSWKWRVDPDAVAALADDAGGRVAILNPYDRILFDRPRLTELFGFEYVLEQFKPKAERRFGYFAHPILIGERFAGLLDAEVDRDAGVLSITAVHELFPWEPEERAMVDAEIQDLADWLGVRAESAP